jgi:hypothetical protein
MEKKIFETLYELVSYFSRTINGKHFVFPHCKCPSTYSLHENCLKKKFK